MTSKQYEIELTMRAVMLETLSLAARASAARSSGR